MCFLATINLCMFYRRAYPWSEDLRLENVNKSCLLPYPDVEDVSFLLQKATHYLIFKVQNIANENWTDVLLFKLRRLTSYMTYLNYMTYLKCSKRTFLIKWM